MKKILVVDDEEHIRLLLREELEDEGYAVITAGDGEEALRLVREEKPDLVTLDIKMPGESGLMILRKIRETDYDLPVILCTAYSSYKTYFSTVAADHYVVKSSDFTELKEKIRVIFEQQEDQDSGASDRS
jgi:DNA-binding response OmpR family regulator